MNTILIYVSRSVLWWRPYLYTYLAQGCEGRPFTLLIYVSRSVLELIPYLYMYLGQCWDEAHIYIYVSRSVLWWRSVFHPAYIYVSSSVLWWSPYLYMYLGQCCDEGRSFFSDAPDSPAAQSLLSIAQRMFVRLFSNAILT